MCTIAKLQDIVFRAIAPAFPSPEAAKRLCASLRSATRSAVVRRTAAQLALVQFRPFRRRLLQQILIRICSGLIMQSIDCAVFTNIKPFFSRVTM